MVPEGPLPVPGKARRPHIRSLRDRRKNVNTPRRVDLRTVEERARTVLATLKLAPGTVDLRRQVRTFITCNGYQSVLRAAPINGETGGT
jgi:hypothetical protein